MKKEGVSKETIMSYLVEMHELIIEMNKRMATKDDLEQMKIEIIDPIIKAVDKDAEIVVGHERRIRRLEHKIGISAK